MHGFYNKLYIVKLAAYKIHDHPEIRTCF